MRAARGGWQAHEPPPASPHLLLLTRARRCLAHGVRSGRADARGGARISTGVARGTGRARLPVRRRVGDVRAGDARDLRSVDARDADGAARAGGRAAERVRPVWARDRRARDACRAWGDVKGGYVSSLPWQITRTDTRGRCLPSHWLLTRVGPTPPRVPLPLVTSLICYYSLGQKDAAGQTRHPVFPSRL